MAIEKAAVAFGGHHQKIEITDFRELLKNTLRGVFTAKLPDGMIIHGLMVHERSGSRWLGLPSREWTDQRGQKQFAKIIEFVDRRTSDEWQAAVLAALDAHLAGAPR